MSVALANVHPLAPSRTFPDLRTHRQAEEYVYDVRALDGTYLGSLGGVVSASLSWNLHASIRGTGSLVWHGPVEAMPNWRKVLVSVSYRALTWDGHPMGWPLGVFRCVSARTVHDGTGAVSCDVGLYDQSVVLRQDTLGRDSQVDAGTNVVGHVRAIIDGRGASLSHAVEDDDTVLPSTLMWDAGTSWMVIANELLATIGHEGLWADPSGALRSRPYVLPSDRPIADYLVAGEDAIHEPSMAVDRDDFGTANRVTVYSRALEEGAVSYRAQVDLGDVLPGHPLSREAIGYVVDRVEEIDAATQAVVTSTARRFLLEGVSNGATLEASHAPMPWLVGLRLGTDVIESGTVETIDVTCTPGESWRTSLREVS